MQKMMCIAAAALSFCAFFELKASGKEKPLLKVHESIKGGWVLYTEHRSLEVTQSGRVSLKGRTKVMLSAAELQALRNFLDSQPVKDLHDSYFDRELCLDCGAHSMEIEMNVHAEAKRISLNWRMAPHFKDHPAPLHDLVCKIYGLEKRVGAVRIDPDGCDAASLDLVPKPEP